MKLAMLRARPLASTDEGDLGLELIQDTWATLDGVFRDAYLSADAASQPRVQAVRDMARDAARFIAGRRFADGDALVLELESDLKAELAMLNQRSEELCRAEAFLTIGKAAAKTAWALSRLAS